MIDPALSRSGVSPTSSPTWRWVERGRTAAALPVAEALLSRALSADPENLVLRRQLAGVYYDQARWLDAVQTLHDVGGRTDARCAHLLGQAYLAARSLDSAVTSLEQACRLGAAARTDLAEAIRLRDGDEAAAPLCQAMLAENPDDTVSLAIEGGRLLRSGDTDSLEALCSGLAARGADNAQLLALWASVRAARGDTAGVDEIVNYDRCLCVRQLAVGTADQVAFRQALATEIVDHPNLTAPNPRRATVDGARVNAPLTEQAVRFGALAAAIRAAIEDYAAHLPDDLLLPRRRNGREAALDIWAVILRDKGHQLWHLHPRAFISGVFYVTVPDASEGSGALEFGLLPAAAHSFPAWHRTIQPRPGMLVLFPSSFVHRTIPSDRPEPRISVAFDVVAV
jgi:uncharacterized protein (TIGR02466 family)